MSVDQGKAADLDKDKDDAEDDSSDNWLVFILIFISFLGETQLYCYRRCPSGRPTVTLIAPEP